MKYIFSAPTILFLLFFGVSLASNFSGGYYDYSDKYVYYLLLSWIVFCLGYFQLRLFRLPRHVFVNRIRPSLLVTTYLVCAGVGILLNVTNFCYVVGPECISPKSVLLYRVFVIDEKVSTIPGTSIFNFFFFVAPAFCYTYYDRLKRWHLIFIVACTVLFVIMSSARSSLFVITLIFYYFYILGRKFSGRLVFQGIFIVSGLLFGFALIGELVGKPMEELSFLSYFIAPSHAFDAILNQEGNFVLQDVWLSFSPLHGIISRLYDIEFNSAMLPNFFTPFPTNVYTLLGVYVNDYGAVGALFWIFLFGILSGLIENGFWSNKDDFYKRLLCALNLTILTLSVFYDYYTTSGIMWFILIFGFIFFRPSQVGSKGVGLN